MSKYAGHASVRIPLRKVLPFMLKSHDCDVILKLSDQEHWKHEALETYITYIAGLLHKTNIFQDYTFSVINGDYATQKIQILVPFISLYKTLHPLLCQSRSWPFIAIYLSQMVFVKIHSRSFMKIVKRVFLVQLLNLYLNYTINQIKHLQ